MNVNKREIGNIKFMMQGIPTQKQFEQMKITQEDVLKRQKMLEIKMADALKGAQRTIVIERDLQLLTNKTKSSLEEYYLAMDGLKERIQECEVDTSNARRTVSYI